MTNIYSLFPLSLLLINSKYVSGESIDDCMIPESVNSTCSVGGKEVWPRADCDDLSIYYSCIASHLKKFVCGPNYPIFDSTIRACSSHNRRKRQIGSQTVDEACRFNTDCLNGMYCNNGLCTCTTNYVQRGSYCYQKINPGQTGCIYLEQCNTVWFGSTCQAGVCTCPSTDTRAVITRDGTVCVATGDTCPLPGGGTNANGVLFGTFSLLSYQSSTTVETCGYTQATPLCSSTNGGYSVAELYDCVQKSTNGAEGVCCPNRALTCQMPRQEGTGGTGQSRWWYNAATDQCISFTWNDNGPGNSNNFQSEAHCLTYCQNRCQKGHPSYSTTSSNQVSLNSPLTCQTTSSCSGNYACTQIGSNSICCPGADFICGVYGGIDNPTSTTNTAGLDPGFDGSGIQQIVSYGRYYYNTNTRNCLPFQWNGYGGNFNNFANRQECENYCAAVLCERGEPLKDTLGSSQSCSSSTQCPSSHTCNNNVCCPTKQTICAQGQAEGTACTTNSFVTKYYYNSVTRQCESFTFGGCNGNANNFDQQIECDNYCRSTSAEPICPQGQAYRDIYGNFYVCNTAGGSNQCPVNYECYYDGTNYGCCPTRSYTCSQPNSQGRVCGVRISRWYFDTTTQSCQSFVYLGCDGNSNNFANRQTCESYCGAGGCPNGGTPYQESSGTNRICSTSVTCPSSYECTNVVLSTSSAVNYCCPTRAYICSQSPVSGDNCGTGGVTRYAFSLSSRACTSFTYNGCGGNGNNFETLAACQNFCNSAGCSAGEAVYTQPGGTSSLTCNIQVQATCPQGYSCKFDTVTNNYVCCGSTDMGVCPNLEKAYIDPTTLNARECQPSNTNACPAAYLCRLSTLRNRYYCCRPASGSQCPSGYAAYVNSVAGIAQTCDIGGVRNPCPAGYSCQTPVAGAFEGYCCSTQPLCPSGFNVYQTTNGQYRSCSIGGLNTCPQGYQCQSTTSNSIVGYCCSTTIGTAVCGSGTPFLVSSSPVVCNPNTPSNCQSGYICQLYSPTNTYYCCAGGDASVCGTGGSVYTVGDVSQVCNPAGNDCPADYTCTFAAATSSYYCCRGGNAGLCPNGAPYMVSGIVQTCSPGLNNCPSTYSCQQNPTNRNAYYCCSGSGNTVCGPAAEPYQPGGSPVSCSPTNNRCPTTYNCQIYTGTNTYYCCKPTAVATTDICGVSRSPYLRYRQPMVCSPSSNACPGSHPLCLRYDTTNTFFCCSSSLGSACPNGGQLSQVTCSPTPNTCPPGQQCQFISGAGRYLCCGGQATVPNLGTCPNGSPATQTPCSPNLPNPCGTGATCQLVQTINAYRCCPGLNQQSAGTCPSGGTVTSTTCSPNVQGNCGGGTCQFITQNNRYQCCSGSSVQNQGSCPQGGTMTQQTCSPSITTSCSSGQSCQLIGATNRYQCCIGGPRPQITQPPTFPVRPVNLACPSGQTAYTNPTSGLPQTCRLGVATSCPGGYSCVTANSNFLCCRSNNVPTTGTGGQSPYCLSGTHYNYRNTNLPLTCRLGGSPCPPQYSCQQGTGGRYFCCSGGFGRDEPETTSAQEHPEGSGGCPSGIAYITSGSNGALPCFPQGQGCPNGYKCVYSFSNTRYQCCSQLGVVNNGHKKMQDPIMGIGRTSHNNSRPSTGPDCTSTRTCKAGEYGCSEDFHCSTQRCRNRRCVCSSNELIRPNGRCGRNCPPNYRNHEGTCVEVSVFDDPENQDLVLPSVEDLEVDFDPEKQMLKEKCVAKPCKEKRAFCNSSGRCECYTTYRAVNGTCTLAEHKVRNGD